MMTGRALQFPVTMEVSRHLFGAISCSFFVPLKSLMQGCQGGNPKQASYQSLTSSFLFSSFSSRVFLFDHSHKFLYKQLSFALSPLALALHPH